MNWYGRKLITADGATVFSAICIIHLGHKNGRISADPYQVSFDTRDINTIDNC